MTQPIRDPGGSTATPRANAGNPAPLGLAAFGISALAAGFVISGRWPHPVQDFLVLVPLFLVFGGIVQFIAAMWAYARGRAAEALFFGSFGGLFTIVAMYGMVAAGLVVRTSISVLGPIAVAIACFCFIALVLSVALRDHPGF